MNPLSKQTEASCGERPSKSNRSVALVLWGKWEMILRSVLSPKHLNSEDSIAHSEVVGAIPVRNKEEWKEKFWNTLNLYTHNQRPLMREVEVFISDLLLSERQEIVKSLEGMNTLPFSSQLCQNQNGLEYCGTCEQAWEMCSCPARNTGYKKALFDAISIITKGEGR